MKIAIIGTGYVGLVTGIGLASFGNDVTCIDANLEKVSKLQNGTITIYEPGLETLLHDNLKSNRIHFSSDAEGPVSEADVIFVAVGTPQAEDGSADLSQVMSTARTIGEILRKVDSSGKVIVLKSTVPVGTTRTFARILASYILGGWAHVASNPEFLREGTAVRDFLNPDRIVIGTESDVARETLLKLYSPFPLTKILCMEPESSELVKYASNALLATRVSFMNELANFAISIGADINKVREGVGADSRIGPQYLYPGPGYGGSCLPKDVSALIHMAEIHGHDLRVVRAAQEANFEQKQMLTGLVRKNLGSIRGQRITVWGLAFKANTDDIRESPSVTLVENLLRLGAKVRVHDPQAMSAFRLVYGDQVHYYDDIYESLYEADALVLGTDWDQYRSPNLDRIKSISPDIIIFDGRNIWDQKDFESKGIEFHSICRTLRRPKSHPTNDNLKPVRMLDTPNGVVSSRRVIPLQNHSMDETGPSLALVAK